MTIGILFLFLQHGFSQFSATTTNGRTVTLHEDGTWVYTDGPGMGTTEDRDCEINLYGKVLFKNNSNKDGFVVIANEYGSIKYKLKVPAHESKYIDNIIAKTRANASALKYQYVVLLEEPSSQISYERLDYKANGTFFVKICGIITNLIDDL
jgi:hypothetical protein